MPKIWSQWMSKVRGLSQAAVGLGARSQSMNWGSDAAQSQGHEALQPYWLTPAYLRQHRSGDRISR